MRTYKNKTILFLVCALGIIAGCEKEITVDVPLSERKLVVEGYIEQGAHPYVILTKSNPYFAAIDSNSLIDLLVLNAIVTVSDGAITDTLAITFDANIFPFLIYRSNNITGQIGSTYSLTIRHEGNTYFSSTTIPAPIPLDSLWFKVQPGKDTLGFVWAHLTDPVATGNNYRWFAKRIGKDEKFIAPIGSVFDDKFVNGKSFDFAYNRGSVPNSNAEDDKNDEQGYFKIGDEIVVKFCTIDKANFLFWRAAEIEVSNNGNPFASPNTIPSNITGDAGAFGVWGGYGVALDTLIAQ